MNYIALIDSIVNNIYKELENYDFDSELESEKALEYLKRRMESLYKEAQIVPNH